MDFKGLANHAVVIRMDSPPSSKRVPLVFHAWIVMEQASEDQNIFRACQLLLDRTGVSQKDQRQLFSNVIILFVVSAFCCFVMSDVRQGTTQLDSVPPRVQVCGPCRFTKPSAHL